MWGVGFGVWGRHAAAGRGEEGIYARSPTPAGYGTWLLSGWGLGG